MTDFFDSLTTEDDSIVLARLHERLAADAARAGVLDVVYRTVDSPVGPLLVAATDVGLVRLAFSSEGHDAVLARLASTIGARILRVPGRLDRVARQLDEYFDGRRTTFDLVFDLRSSGFRKQVLDHLTRIPYGATESYAAVAGAAGSPRAVRAVGTACANNPLPVVIPCHRVIRSDGTYGQYLGGLEAKSKLLDLERESVGGWF